MTLVLVTGATLGAPPVAPRLLAQSVTVPAASPPTRAERTGFAETSRYDDVTAFLDTLRRRGAPITLLSLATTADGRAVPCVVASRPRVTTPAAARRLRRPVVYLNANIHAGEVEGKEAVLALLRDLTADARPNVLDSLVLLVVPDYNADGNERLGPHATNRDEQRGPDQVGVRANALGLDLNRDYVKAEAPETRGALAAFRAWNPDVYVDLHATDGSYHGYALTYSPSLAPAAPLAAYTRGLLAELRTRLRASHDGSTPLETFDYGNFDGQDGEHDVTDSAKTGWYTFDARPRFGTNYYGLRGRVAVLSEAFSHDPFDRRVASTARFVRALLSLVAERGAELRARVAAADRARPDSIPMGSTLTTRPRREPVLVERLVRTGDSARTEPGVPVGVQRTGRVAPQTMPVYDRFEGRRWVRRPVGYLLPATDTAALARLAMHGVRMTPVRAGRRFAAVQSFTVDSVGRAEHAFQKHYPTSVTGIWQAPAPFTAPAAMVYIPTNQPLGTLAVYLLEPTSEDGLTTWNVFDARLAAGQRHPVRRVR